MVIAQHEIFLAAAASHVCSAASWLLPGRQARRLTAMNRADMSTASEIKLIAEGLEDGETYRGDCPACSRRGTFTATKDAGSVVWNCYSTHCNFAGSLGGVRASLVRTRSRKQEFTPFTGELEELDEDWRVYLYERIGWGEDHLDMAQPYYAREERRIAYPIYGPMGRRRGWVLRSYASDCDPRWKALTRMDCDEPHISWYRVLPASAEVLVVEDIPSAVRAAAAGFPQVVAMCGGGIGPDYVQEITAYARRVRWAFDPDATAAALRHHRKYGLFFDDSVVVPLESDLKDMKEKDLCKLINAIQETK